MEYTALMKDPQLKPLWTRGFGNECGRLFQGIPDITGTDMCFFIKLTDIPKYRKITYCKKVCDYKSGLLLAATDSTIPATLPLPRQI
jgi:hypothetical protein